MFLPNLLKSISVHKSRDIIENFTSDNLYLRAVLDLLFKPSSFVPDLIPRPEWLVVLPIFATDIL